MCRRNVMWGCCVVAFGLGMLVGTWLKSGFLTHLLGIGLLFLGLCVLRKH